MICFVPKNGRKCGNRFKTNSNKYEVINRKCRFSHKPYRQQESYLDYCSRVLALATDCNLFEVFSNLRFGKYTNINNQLLQQNKEEVALVFSKCAVRTTTNYEDYE